MAVRQEVEVLLIGGGNLGSALIRGWQQDAAIRVTVVEQQEQVRARLMDLSVTDLSVTAVTAVSSCQELAADYLPTLVIFAVKPQDMAAALALVRAWLGAPVLCLSVAAGISLDSLALALAEQTPIIRVMPNTAITVGAGMMVCCGNDGAYAHHELVRDLLSQVGEVVFVEDERLIDVATAVSGSGPAYFVYMMEALVSAGVSLGLSEDLARDLVVQTAYGSSLLAKKESKPLAQLRLEVTSPGGTTAAALEILSRDEAWSSCLKESVKAAYARARALRQR